MCGVLQLSGHFNFKIVKPSISLPVFPMEEDIMNHIGEALSIVSSGSPMWFNDDPFVRGFPKGMEPYHQPIYHIKLVRLVCCVVDCQAREVSLLVIFVIYASMASPQYIYIHQTNGDSCYLTEGNIPPSFLPC